MNILKSKKYVIKAAEKGLFEVALLFLHQIVSILRKWRVPSRCIVIGITGSCGKTMTKDLLADILSSQHRVVKSEGTRNAIWATPRFLLSFDSRNEFWVQEVGAYESGRLAKFVRVLRPDVGVITTIGWDHYTAFRGPDGVAKDKLALIRSLPQDGIAVLNADDSRALAMRHDTSAKVVTFGLDGPATLCADSVSSRWPERLSFTLIHDNKRIRVNTRFCGEYLVPNVLAALATGLALGVPVEKAVEAVEKSEPYSGRMQPVETSNNVWFIRDDWKAPYWSIGVLLDYVANARAVRKIVVLGEISDRPGNLRSKYCNLVERSVEVADMVLLVGPPWGQSFVTKLLERNEKVIRFKEISQANDFLNEYLQAGDLVVLKGNSRSHLGRLALSKLMYVGCWKMNCSYKMFCNECRHVAENFSE